MRNFLNNKKQLKSLEKMLLLDDIKNIVVITGAGISAESGINTFRDKGGMWENHSVYEVARPEAMELTPELFFKFQNDRAKEMKTKKPNKAHFSLKELENNYNVNIITQNVDDLHEKAFSSNLLHIHGTLHKVICNQCDNETDYIENIYGQSCPKCELGKFRPDVVLFKESLKDLYGAYSIIENADLFIQIGTSGNVYPVADFPATYDNGIKINISLDEPNNSQYFDYDFRGKATKIVPLIVNLINKMIKTN